MSSTIELINTGILMGIIHVLTGPDHLSALATLSGTNITRNKRSSSFLLGVRWGIGHSLGLLVVGGTLIAMEETNSEWISMDDSLSRVLESFVGIFMICLGMYGLLKACRNRREGYVRPLSNSMTSLTTHKDGSGDDGEEGDLELAEEEEEVKQETSPRSGGYRRESMEIVTQMANALNRDGDSMRGSGTNNQNNDNNTIIDDDDVEARIFNAVESLRRNSDTDGDIEDDDKFLTTLKASAKGALSQSFVKILNKKPGSSPLPKASSLVHKHAAPENSIMLDPPPPEPWVANTSRFNACCFGGSGRCTPNVLALIAGIVHGVAGPGGVLGVIPAVQLRDAKLASTYLITFCVTSTLVMGAFAAFYGTFSQWLAGGGTQIQQEQHQQEGGGSSSSTRRQQRRSGVRSGSGRVFLVEIGSAFLSLAVGIIWLVLLSVGKLDEVFP